GRARLHPACRRCFSPAAGPSSCPGFPGRQRPVSLGGRGNWRGNAAAPRRVASCPEAGTRRHTSDRAIYRLPAATARVRKTVGRAFCAVAPPRPPVSGRPPPPPSNAARRAALPLFDQALGLAPQYLELEPAPGPGDAGFRALGVPVRVQPADLLHGLLEVLPGRFGALWRVFGHGQEQEIKRLSVRDL